jgi:hypothetical protein
VWTPTPVRHSNPVRPSSRSSDRRTGQHLTRTPVSVDGDEAAVQRRSGHVTKHEEVSEVIPKLYELTTFTPLGTMLSQQTERLCW